MRAHATPEWLESWRDVPQACPQSPSGELAEAFGVLSRAR